jgi:hypothetical protein
MHSALNDYMIQFLKSFLSVFGAEIVSFSICEGSIDGYIVWEDDSEEEMGFSWDKIYNSTLLVDCSKVCEYLRIGGFLTGDKINISERQLIDNLENLGWIPTNGEMAINYLCSVDVRMFDQDVQINSLFIHF